MRTGLFAIDFSGKSHMIMFERENGKYLMDLEKERFCHPDLKGVGSEGFVEVMASELSPDEL